MRRLSVGLLLAVTACGGNGGATSTTEAGQSTVPVTTSPVTTSPVTTTPTGTADCPVVLEVTFAATEREVFTVSTTVRSVDIEGVSFADAWEVRDLEGTVLGTRVLAHPHTNEQPFTRSLSNVVIPADVTQVEVAARDSVRGFCGTALIVEVPHP